MYRKRSRDGVASKKAYLVNLGFSANPNWFKATAAGDERADLLNQGDSNTGETRSKEDVKTLKILSYNVWFAKDVEIHIRMRRSLPISMRFFRDMIGRSLINAQFLLIRQAPSDTFTYSKLPVKSFGCPPGYIQPTSYYSAGPPSFLQYTTQPISQLVQPGQITTFPTSLLVQVQPTCVVGQTATPPRSRSSTVTSGHAITLPHAFTAGTLHDPASGAWNIDTCASSHLNNSVTSLSEIFNTCMYPSIPVGDGHSIPVTNTSHSILPTPTKSLHLNNVLITPHIVKNLIYVHQFVRDNNCTIEFDVFGFSVKDFLTRRVLLRCDSAGDLYPTPSPIPHAFLVSQHMWHQCLRHPWGKVPSRLIFSNFISYNNEEP
ncbi:hypothetical protein Tco_0845588 [Tanacetum coccineum]